MRRAFSFLLATVVLAWMGDAPSGAQQPRAQVPMDKIQPEKSKGKLPDLNQILDLLSSQPDSQKKASNLDLSQRYREFPQLPPEQLKAELDMRLKRAAEREFIAKFEAKLQSLKSMMEKSDTSPEAKQKLVESMQQHLRNNQELLSDPDLRKMVDKLKADLPPMNGSGDALEKLAQMAQTAEPPVPKGLDFSRDHWAPPQAAPDDATVRWLRNLAEKADESGLGKYLAESPKWREFMQNLHKEGLGEHPAGLPLRGMTGKFADAARDLWRPEWSWRPGLGRLPMPDLAGWRPPSLSLPSVQLPVSVGAPSMPSGPSTNIEPLGWVALVGLAGVLLWMWRRTVRRPVAAASVTLGDWPVAPDSVSTRRQLIQAFDYLALLRLGQDALCWNHRLIASRLDDAGRRGQAAQRLADVYEAVRYTQGPETLDADLSRQQCDAVRRDLCLLASIGSVYSSRSA